MVTYDAVGSYTLSSRELPLEGNLSFENGCSVFAGRISVPLLNESGPILGWVAQKGEFFLSFVRLATTTEFYALRQVNPGNTLDGTYIGQMVPSVSVPETLGFDNIEQVVNSLLETMVNPTAESTQSADRYPCELILSQATGSEGITLASYSPPPQEKPEHPGIHVSYVV